jgi:hypothetical protein
MRPCFDGCPALSGGGEFFIAHQVGFPELFFVDRRCTQMTTAGMSWLKSQPLLRILTIRSSARSKSS